MKALRVAAWTLILTARVFAVLYVSPNGSSVAPYDSLATAATNIQTAVDAAVDGDTVQVAAGTYLPGAEIGIFKAITLESIQGADATVLDGQNIHRVLQLSGGASVDGFTIQNGNSSTFGGGVICRDGALVQNSVVTNNFAPQLGGGIHCVYATVRNCVIAGNSSQYRGGGIFCENGTVENCVIAQNSALERGGGIYFEGYGIVRNAIIWDNTAWYYANWYQSGSPDFSYLFFSHVCTEPAIGENSIGEDPQFDDSGTYRISLTSPCLNAGSNQVWMDGATDPAGNPRIRGSHVDIGAYEADLSSLASIDILNTNETVSGGLDTITLTGTNNLMTVGDLWWTNTANSASGVLPVLGTTFEIPSIPLVDLTNSITVYGTNEMGYVAQDEFALFRDPVHYGESPFHYVSTNGSSVWPFDSLATAATNFVDAITVAHEGDIVRVDAGIYFPGSQIRIEKAIAFESIHGVDATVLDGNNSHGLLYLANGASVDGFTIQNGYQAYGAGIYCPGDFHVQNCVVSNNVASNYGGGIYRNGEGTIRNCVISGNSAEKGGGIYTPQYDLTSAVESCVIAENTATYYGGGFYSSSGGIVRNSIIWNNTAPEGANWYNNNSTLYFSNVCTTPTLGESCIAEDPQFDDSGTFNLLPSSPCINAGSNEVWMVDALDLAGNPRIRGPRVDIGAYEAEPAGLAYVDILNTNANVESEMVTYVLNGTNNTAAVGNLWWTNTANSARGVVPVTGITFEIATIPLAIHTNHITVYATNQLGYVSRDELIIIRDTVHHGESPVHYVSPSGTSIWPYTTLTTAANTLQDAFDAVIEGDTIRVDAGTYMPGKVISIVPAITLQSLHGAETTIIDGQGVHRVLHISSGVLVDGFTIQNGAGSDGAGIYCYEGGTVKNCIISGNSSENDGGGVYCYQGGNVEHCVLSGNSAIITRFGEGGGVYCYQGGTVKNCLISGNSASHVGGGAYCYEGGTVKNCVISDNTSADDGGGVCLYRAGVLEHCVISRNTSDDGGGVYAAYDGEGISVKHCVITENSARYIGGGIRWFGASGNVLNTIVWGNSASSSANFSYWGDPLLLSHICTTPAVGEHCVSNYPYLNAEGRLSAGSPCIDAGMEIEGVTSDIEGTPRPLDGDADGVALPDIGAYEFVNALADSDGDTVTDPSEIVAGTDPTDAADWFHITALDGSTIWFPSVLDRLYTLEASTNLTAGGWQTITNQVGNGAEIQLTDPNTNAAAFYRVRVEAY